MKRGCIVNKYELIELFLTHTVQMKPLLVFQLLGRLPEFLTHTVQMKLNPELLAYEPNFEFLTHTVQMKLVLK